MNQQKLRWITGIGYLYGLEFTPAQWDAFCEEHGQDPDDPDAFCVTPPNRLKRMMTAFLADQPPAPPGVASR